MFPRKRVILQIFFVTALGSALWIALQTGSDRKFPLVQPSIEKSLPNPVVGSLSPLQVSNGGENGGKELAERYRLASRYPSYCQPIDSAADPVYSKFNVHPNRMPSSKEGGPILFAWPSKINYVPPEPIYVYAKLVQKDGSLLPANLEGTLQDQSGQEISSFTLRDDGIGGDAVADDNIYTAQIEFPSDIQANAIGNFSVYIKARQSQTSSDTIGVITGFSISYPMAKLTGNYRDSVQEGSLVIEAEVDVAMGARYYLEGSLYSQDGTRAIGRSQNAVLLEMGIGWIPLRFYGLMIREAKLPSPFLLKYVSLARTGSVPLMRADLIENAFVTSQFRLDQLINMPFNQQTLVRKEQLLLTF